MNPLQAHHDEKGEFVRDLEPGQRFLGFYQVRLKQLEDFRDKTRGKFLTLMLGDRTGEILARVWEGAEALAAEFETGDIVKVAGDVEEYQRRVQVIVAQLRPARTSEYDLRDFRPASQYDIDVMSARLRERIASVEQPYLAALLKAVFDDEAMFRRFCEAPAARKVHHAWVGGLLEHTLEVARLAEPLLDLYPELDGDLLLTGILLHDIGKVFEFEWDLGIDYSDEGRLIGHVALSDDYISAHIDAIDGFPAELKLRVRHMLLSHHGRYEYGAPRRPKTMEAIALHTLENVSVQVNRFHGLLDVRRGPGQHWTSYDRLLGRSLYAGPGDDTLTIDEQSYEA